MARFIFLYIVVQSLLNAYVFIKIRRAFRMGPAGMVTMAALLLLVMLLPVAVRVVGSTAMRDNIQGVAFLGFTWIVITMWFGVAGIVLDIWNLIAGALVRDRVKRMRFQVRPRAWLMIVGAAVLLMFAAGWIGNLRLHRVTRVIVSPRIPAGSPPLRVVQVTDLHFGYVRGSTYLEELATALRELQPDLVVLTGDMLDVALPRAQPFIDALAEVRPPLGKFAVLGNHEYYVREAKSVPLLAAAGCVVLRGTNITIDAGGWPLSIAGVDDPVGRYSSQESRIDEDPILPAADDAGRPFTLLLKHQPRVANASRGRFDLQLSGHTHGGQLFPFHFMVRAAHQYFRGMYGIAAGGQIYVGHGAGTWGPPLRHCAPREITLFILTPKS